MLKVNLNNYEAYFLDYAEGNLTSSDKKEVEKFLALHPEKFDELQEFENITISSESSFEFNKSLLKKDISDIKIVTDDNFEEFCIANFEGDLNEKAIEQYQDHLKKFPEKKKTEELYKKAFLAPEKIKYPHKSKLKHFDKALFIRRIAFAGAAAASIGLLFTLQNPFNKANKEDLPPTISDNIEVPVQKSISNVDETKEVGEPKKMSIEKTEKKVYVSQNPTTKNQTEAITIEESPQRSPIIIPKINSSKAELRVDNVAANQLAMRIDGESSTENNEIYKKTVSLSEFAFNEIKDVIPESVQDLADRKPNLLKAAEKGKKEINELLSKQVTIEKEIDKEGNIKSFALNSSFFSFYTTKVKK